MNTTEYEFWGTAIDRQGNVVVARCDAGGWFEDAAKTGAIFARTMHGTKEDAERGACLVALGGPQRNTVIR